MATGTVKKPAGKRQKWADIFSNVDQFDDDMQIVLKDKDGNELTYALGDLREYNEATNGELLSSIEERENNLKTESQNIEAARTELLRRHEEIVKAGAGGGGRSEKKIVAGKKVTNEDIADDLGMDENDPIVGSVVRKLNAMQSDSDTKLKGVTEQLGQFQNVLKTVLGTYLEDGLNKQYDGLKSVIEKVVPEKERKNFSFDKLKKHAEDNRFMDKSGRLNLERAYKDMAFDFIVEQEAETRASKRMKDRQNEERMRQVTKPSRPGQNLPEPSFDVSKSRDPLGDAMNAAANDSEIWGQLTAQE